MATAKEQALFDAAKAYVASITPTPPPVPDPPKPPVDPTPVPTTATNAVVWFQFGSNEPNQAKCDDAISRKPRYILIQPWWTTTAAYFKKKFPVCKVIGYKDLMSSRSNAESLGNNGPTGVTYSESQRNGWLTGRVMSGYTYQEVVQTWNPSYRTAWTNNVLRWLAENPNFDGVFADNLVSPQNDYYGTGLNEAQLSQGCLDLVRQAGPQVAAKGKLFIPNITDGRLNAGFFAAGSTPGGGGCDEMFCVWPGGGYNTDPASQIAEGGVPGIFIARSNATDRKSANYGFGCFLLSGEGAYGGAFYASGFDEYNQNLIWYPEYAQQVGTPTAGLVSSNGLLSRMFSNGVVYVNTTGSNKTITLPGQYKKADGSVVSGNFTIYPTSAEILVK